MMLKEKISKIARNYLIAGDYVVAVPYGSGHINDTYAVEYNQGGTFVRYIFQRINHNIFKQPEQLMDNIQRVTAHIKAKLATNKDSTRHTLTVVQSRTDKPFYRDEENYYWRVYVFVERALSYDVIETPEQAFQAASAFGEFQNDLVDLPAPRLHETIPHFHNTPWRYEMLEKAIAEDKVGRAASCRTEIEFALARKNDAKLLINLHNEGKIPERITHNDTKLNNVLIDNITGEGICVIDLDTVMPGLIHYDFGDMVRTSTSPAAEDEKDLSKVTMQFEMFEALLRGYLKSAGKFLNATERHYLPFSGKLITLEIGVRFLTDYLQGDVYFKIKRPEHNLDRCRTQFKLVESIENQYDRMMKLLESI